MIDESETGTPEQWRSNVPNEIQNIDRWLMWDSSAETPRRPHWKGDFSVSYSDEDDWHSFSEAVEAAQEKDSWGIGFVTGDDVAVIDVDGAAEIGDDDRPHPKDWVPSLRDIKRAGDGDAYVEWSPSGTGLHIPVKQLDADWWTDVSVEDADHEGVDMLQGQFCTVTGDAERGFDGSVVEFNPKIDLWLRDAKQNIEAVNDGDELDGRDNDDWSPDEEWLTEGNIRDALSHLNADCGYSRWRDIGFAVAEFFFEDENDRSDECVVDEAHEKAVEVFKEWSETADEKWDAQAEEQCERIIEDSWDRKQVEDDPITVGTLIAYARNAGWEMPDPPESVQAAAARDTVAEFIGEFAQVDERPEKPDVDDVLKNGDADVDEKLNAWPSTREKRDVMDAVCDMHDEDFESVKIPLAARLRRQSPRSLERQRSLLPNVGSLMNFGGEFVKVVRIPDDAFAVPKTILNFELEVESVLSVEGEGRMSNITVRPSEPSEAPFELQIEPKVFNDSRRFKDEVLSERFSTTIEADMGESDVMDMVRKHIGRQDVPELVGQKQMGLSRSGNEFVTPHGVICDDGWSDDAETVFVERDVGAERKFKANPEEHTDVDTDAVAEMIELFTRTRDPERFVPVLGWFYATPFRPRITERTRAFNLMFVEGESGVGKTGTLGVGSRMFGMSAEPNSCSDTTFATITTLASSRGVPVWLDEYKESEMADWQKNKLHELLRKAATGGVEQRGNADQTTEEYHLRAPVVISGETRVRGSAEQRRAIDVQFRDEPTQPDTPEYRRFKELVGDAVTDEDGNVTFPDSRFELEQHAVAFYGFVTGMDDAQFEEKWFAAREHVSKRLAEWDAELDDLEVQGLQTIVFGFRVMRHFADEVGADVSKLPCEEELDDALRHVADVDGKGRETHTDRFLHLSGRAASADYLEEDTHYRLIHGGDELRLDVDRVFDALSRYVKDHALSEDLLGSARDYKSRLSEQEGRDDSYVSVTSQNTPPIGRCAGITIDVAEQEIEGFDARLFAEADDEVDVALGDDADGDGDGGGSGSGAKPLANVTSRDDYVTVTGEVVKWSATPDQVACAGGPVKSGSVCDATGRRDVVLFDYDAGSEPAGINHMKDGETVRIENAAVTEYRGTPQIELDAGTTITVIQEGVGHTEHASAEKGQGVLGQRVKVDGSGDSEEMKEVEQNESQKERREFIARMSEGGTVPVSKVIERCIDEFSVNERKVENDIRKMKARGELYEPQEGVLRHIGR